MGSCFLTYSWFCIAWLYHWYALIKSNACIISSIWSFYNSFILLLISAVIFGIFILIDLFVCLMYKHRFYKILTKQFCCADLSTLKICHLWACIMEKLLIFCSDSILGAVVLMCQFLVSYLFCCASKAVLAVRSGFNLAQQ